MPDLTTPPPAPAVAAILPGDLVQITDANCISFRAILMVTETHGWGLGCTMQAMVDGQLAESYQRLRLPEVVMVGVAHLMPPEVLQRRKDAIGTARELARETAA